MSRFAEGGFSPVKIIQHHTSVETRVMGYDYYPYSVNSIGVPKEIADAVRTGFCFNVPEVDCRQTEWTDAHSY